MKIKVIVLDFDNCIVLDENTREGSEEIKDRAWFDVFPEYDRADLNVVLERVKIDIVGGKGDRKDVAERVLRHFGFPETEIHNEVIRRCDSFNIFIQEGIKLINISPRTKEGLVNLSKHFPVYINTATPREAVFESLRALNLVACFKDVFSRPGTKIGNLRNILAAELVKPDELLFIDDQSSGWRAAQEVGCQFIGIDTARNKLWRQNEQSFPIIHSLTELLKLV